MRPVLLVLGAILIIAGYSGFAIGVSRTADAIRECTVRTLPTQDMARPVGFQPCPEEIAAEVAFRALAAIAVFAFAAGIVLSTLGVLAAKRPLSPSPVPWWTVFVFFGLLLAFVGLFGATADGCTGDVWYRDLYHNLCLSPSTNPVSALANLEMAAAGALTACSVFPGRLQFRWLSSQNEGDESATSNPSSEDAHH